MNKKKWVILAGIVLVAAAAVAAGLLLRGVGAGTTADEPITVASGMDFSRWFGPDKKLSKQETGVYYFKLSADVKISAEGIIGNQTVIIDLNGHSITGGANRAFSITDGGCLTLENGTVETAGADADGGVINVDGANCALTLDGVTVTNTDDSHIPRQCTGGVIYANSPTEPRDSGAVVTLRGGTVINGSPSGLRRTGGAVTAAGGTTLYIRDATVRNGKAGTSGNIHLEGQAALYLLGGTVEGGTAVHTSQITGFGGNINAQALSRIFMYDGTVTGGVAEASGGNIFVSNTANVDGRSGLYLYGGTVENGTAAVEGGNIYAAENNSAVRVYGGTVQNGDAMRGGNIFLQNTAMELWGGTLTGKTDSEALISGGNIYAAQSAVSLYDGRIEKGTTQSSGGNIYVTDTWVDIYGGTVADGAVASTDVTRGGGNLFAGGSSTVNMYGGEICGGISNCLQSEESSAAGGNVMIAGTTKMQMFGGTVKNGMVYGKITRGGSVYVYGQAKGSNAVFHMYGGTIENGPLSNTMRGLCIGAYSDTDGDSGHGVARIFGGEVIFTGGADDQNRTYTLYGNKTSGIDLCIFDAEKYEGMYKRATVGPCADYSHSSCNGEVAATCLTQGCTWYACATCGAWCQITAEPTAHTEQTQTITPEDGVSCTEHTCTACDAVWYTDVTLSGEEE